MTVGIKELLDTIFSAKSEHDAMLIKIVKAKLILHGIDPNRVTSETSVDPLLMTQLERLAQKL